MIRMMKSEKELCDFASDLFGGGIPSVSYLIFQIVHFMEIDADFKTIPMQMIDGKHYLSGNNSFKLTKCIYSNSTKDKW